MTHKLSREIKLSDLSRYKKISIRLNNCLQKAIKNKIIPIVTIGDFLDYPVEKLEAVLLSIPSLGRGTLNELHTVINELTKEAPLQLLDLTLSSAEPVLNYSEQFLNIKLTDLVGHYQISERTKNAVRNADSTNNLIIKTVRDYVNLGYRAKACLMKIPNLGRKSVNEIELLISDLLNDTCDLTQFYTLQNDKETLEDNANVNLSGFVLKVSEVLRDEQLEILLQRCVENKTLEDIAIKFNVTRERIRQIEKKAIDKINSLYPLQIKNIIRIIKKLLHENSGLVDTVELKKISQISDKELAVLLYVVKYVSGKKIKYNDNFIYDDTYLLNKKEFFGLVDELILASNWPIDVKSIFESLPFVPEEFIYQHFKQRGAQIKDGKIVAMNNISKTELITFVIRSRGEPITPKTAVACAKNIFDVEMSEHTASSLMRRIDNVLIIDRGVYSLYEFLDISAAEIEKIRNEMYHYLYSEKKYISAKVIIKKLFSNINEWRTSLTPYILLGFAQDDPRFVTKRGLMIGLVNFSKDIKLKPLSNEVIDLVSHYGPISIRMIQEKLSSHRKVLSVGISKILADSPELIQIGPAEYNTIKNEFKKIDLYKDFRFAIQLMLVNEKLAILSIHRNIMLIPSLKHLSITSSKLRYLLKSFDEIKTNGHIYYCDKANPKISSYNKKILNYLQKYKNMKNIYSESQNYDLDDMDLYFLSLDYRININNDNEVNNYTELNSIFTSFG